MHDKEQQQYFDNSLTAENYQKLINLNHLSNMNSNNTTPAPPVPGGVVNNSYEEGNAMNTNLPYHPQQMSFYTQPHPAPNHHQLTPPNENMGNNDNEESLIMDMSRFYVTSSNTGDGTTDNQLRHQHTSSLDSAFSSNGGNTPASPNLHPTTSKFFEPGYENHVANPAPSITPPPNRPDNNFLQAETTDDKFPILVRRQSNHQPLNQYDSGGGMDTPPTRMSHSRKAQSASGINMFSLPPTPNSSTSPFHQRPSFTSENRPNLLHSNSYFASQQQSSNPITPNNGFAHMRSDSSPLFYQPTPPDMISLPQGPPIQQQYLNSSYQQPSQQSLPPPPPPPQQPVVPPSPQHQQPPVPATTTAPPKPLNNNVSSSSSSSSTSTSSSSSSSTSAANQQQSPNNHNNATTTAATSSSSSPRHNRRQSSSSSSGGGHRRSNTSSIDQDSQQQNKFANMNLESMSNEIYSLCKDQYGCRFLQKKLEEKKPKYTQLIFNQTYPHVVELMTDPFGNYLCQRLLEYANDEQRTTLVKTASPELVKIALNQHGTRALQKMIEYVSNQEQVDMIVESLQTNVVKLIKDLNGNHVIQKCLNHLSSDGAQFIFDAVCENCVAVGTHRHGCCVLQRCIDHASIVQKQQLVQQIIDNAITLVQDPFGNYVTQYVLDLGKPEYSEPLIKQFYGKICTLSMQKFSSNVIEKCLRIARQDTTKSLIEELIAAAKLETLLKDNYANYVIQTALDYADPATRNGLVENIRPIIPSIRSTPYGRRIQSKLANPISSSSPSEQQETATIVVAPYDGL